MRQEQSSFRPGGVAYMAVEKHRSVAAGKVVDGAAAVAVRLARLM